MTVKQSTITLIRTSNLTGKACQIYYYHIIIVHIIVTFSFSKLGRFWSASQPTRLKRQCQNLLTPHKSKLNGRSNISLVCDSAKIQYSIENNRQNYTNGSLLLQTCIVEKFELNFKIEILSACRHISCANGPRCAENKTLRIYST